MALQAAKFTYESEDRGIDTKDPQGQFRAKAAISMGKGEWTGHATVEVFNAGSAEVAKARLRDGLLELLAELED